MSPTPSLVLALLLVSAAAASLHAEGAPDPFPRTKRIEIRIPVPGADSAAIEPYRIEHPAEVARIVAAVRLQPTGKAAGWDWPNQVTFVLDDGGAIVTSLGGLPRIFGVRLPGASSSRDHEIPAGLLEALGPHLQRAVEYFQDASGGEALAGANGRPDAGPPTRPGEPVNGLRIHLSSARESVSSAEEIQLVSAFENAGKEPFSLGFWWSRRLRILDADGKVVRPGAGPVLPCGEGEDPLVLAPGTRHERQEHFGCTQPAGCPRAVGWSYALKPGTYRLVLIHEAPAPHAWGQNDRSDAWKGKAASNEVTVTITGK